MTEENKLIKRFKPFKLGFCKCGCNTEIGIKNGSKLKKYVQGHHKFGRSSNWKGGIIVDIHGYKWIRLNGKYYRQHRLIYEEYHKCCLLPWILIHHINEDRSDNSIENLMPVTKGQHNVIHIRRYCSAPP